MVSGVKLDVELFCSSRPGARRDMRIHQQLFTVLAELEMGL
jgi:hypothetical protein